MVDVGVTRTILFYERQKITELSMKHVLRERLCWLAGGILIINDCTNLGLLKGVFQYLRFDKEECVCITNTYV